MGYRFPDHTCATFFHSAVDLYLVHSPGQRATRAETWQAMEAILESGKARSVGVSNYGVHHLQQLLGNCKYRPSVNQVRTDPDEMLLLLRSLLMFGVSFGAVEQAFVCRI
jgi:diketogulonate reductase-like aldo/keto reductase